MTASPFPTYRRDGTPCDFEEYARLSSDPAYRLVANDDLPNGWQVRTVWIGRDDERDMGPLGLQPGLREDGKPRIFGTIVWSIVRQEKHHVTCDEVDEQHWATEAEALAGHKATVERARKLLRAPRGDYICPACTYKPLRKSGDAYLCFACDSVWKPEELAS